MTGKHQSDQRKDEGFSLLSDRCHTMEYGSDEKDVEDPLLTRHDKYSAKIEMDAASREARRRLLIATGFSFFFMLMEVAGGYIAGSLAIMTDAAHLLSDVAGFLISIFAIWVGSFPATSRLSYGFHRAEIIGALVSVILIWVLTGMLVYEACQRTMDIINDRQEQPVNGKIMTVVAVLGLLINLALMSILGHGHSHGPPAAGGGSHGHSHGGDENGGGSHGADEHDHEGQSRKERETNINVRAAYIHALGDLVQSAGVCVAGILIWVNPKWQLADPIATFLFSILVLFSTVGIVQRSLHVLMEGVPEGFDPVEIRKGLRALPSVSGVHHLHLWSLTVGKAALSVHLISDKPQECLLEAQQYLRGIGLGHTTIQVEEPETSLPLCGARRDGC